MLTRNFKITNILLFNQYFQAPPMPKYATGIPNSMLVKANKDDPGVMFDRNGNYVVLKKLLFITYIINFYNV